METRRKNDSAEPTTLNLLRGIQAGDSSCEEQLFTRLRPQLVAMARRKVSQRGVDWDPSDLAQSSLRKAAAALGDFELTHEAAVLSWFERILDNTISNVHRKQTAAKRGGGRAPLSLEDVEPTVECRGSLETLARDELASKAWSDLGATELELARLRLEQQLPWSEIAQRLDLPSGDAARKRFEDCVRRLRGKLSDEAQ